MESIQEEGSNKRPSNQSKTCDDKDLADSAKNHLIKNSTNTVLETADETKDVAKSKLSKRRSIKSTKKLLRAASSAAILNKFSTNSTKQDNKNIESPRKSADVNSSPDSSSKVKTLSLKLKSKAELDTTDSILKRSRFKRSRSQNSIKKHSGQAVSSTPSEASISEQPVTDDNEPDYSNVVDDIRLLRTIQSTPSSTRHVMKTEYGRADVESPIYAYDILIQEIENSFFLGPVLRTVYEGNDHEQFLQRLDCRIKQHDRDIERMCNFHYQGFIDSITELINVRSDVERLKAQALVINKELQESGKEVTRKSDDLIQCQLQQLNVASAIEKLTVCLPVLQLYSKMLDQIRIRRYYSALKTLEQLEHTYLPQIYSYRFCEIMLGNIPKIREEIKEVSMSELKDFLECVRKTSGQIGMVAMQQVEKARKLEQVAVSLQNEQSDNFEKKSENESPAEADLNVDVDTKYLKILNVSDKEKDVTADQNPFTDSNDDNPFMAIRESPVKSDTSNPFLENNDEQETIQATEVLQDVNRKDLSASELIDFSPVYKCLHIFSLVDSRAQFETYYRAERRKQARLVLQPSVSMHDNPDACARFFHQIVGFFVVEDHVLNTTPNLITQQWINDLWEMGISKLIASLQKEARSCSKASVMMNIKNLVVVFADTLKAYGFSVNRLFDLVMEMRDQYGEILLKHWAEKFNVVFNEDNYTPMIIESQMEDRTLVETFPYEDTHYDQASYPRTLKYSRFVPRIYNEIKNFILACLKYCEDLHLSSTEVDDMIRKSTNLLLTRTLAFGLQCLVERPSIGLTELVQIIINTTYLENSCQFIEQFVHSITGVRVGSAHTAKLVGVSTFKDARNIAENQIYTKLNGKIDEFFELSEYAWDMKEPKGMASHYLLDLITFLRHNFEVFTDLPPNVAQTACMSACRHISARMMGLVMDPAVKLVTMASLQQFNLDVMQCEMFSSCDPVPGFKDGALQMSFVEIRQLLDLFLSWDWSSYLADYGNGNSKYLRVNPGTALTLLEKIKEERGHGNIFTSINKRDRERKKLLDTVIRQLRGIINDWTIMCVPRGKLPPSKQKSLLRM